MDFGDRLMANLYLDQTFTDKIYQALLGAPQKTLQSR
jgi:hypothetical protein